MSGTVDGTQFEPVNSLVIVLFAFVGGITTVAAPPSPAALFALLVYAESTYPDLAGVVFVAVARGRDRPRPPARRHRRHAPVALVVGPGRSPRRPRCGRHRAGGRAVVGGAA